MMDTHCCPPQNGQEHIPMHVLAPMAHLVQLVMLFTPNQEKLVTAIKHMVSLAQSIMVYHHLAFSS
jgi:hypothetical protein